MSAVWWFLYGQFLVLLFLGTAVLGLLAKTHAKASESANRLAKLAPVAKAANQAQTSVNTLTTSLTTVTANATFLGGISGTGTLTQGTSGFGGGVWTAGQQSALLTLQSVANGIILALAANGYT